MKKIIATTFLTVFCSSSLVAQADPLFKDSIQMKWVDEKYQAMSLDEKVGQLFIVAAYSNRDAVHENEIKQLIKNEAIGGLIFMQDQAAKQISLTNEYQQLAKIPLLIGIDGEWGVAMRLKGVERFPWNMTLGALRNDELVYQVGKQIAHQAQRLGIHFNFAPSVDVNVNANNPVIGNRSFGSDPDRVAQKGIAYMKGLQDHAVLSSAKHFPGHGNTDKDSHKVLPLIPDNKADLEKYHIAPFRRLIAEGVQSIMVAHLNVPALEKDPKMPSTLSKSIITDYLKGELGFKGIIITDALNMSGVANAFAPGDVDYRAFVAGNDILLFSQGVKIGKQKIREALERGEISEARLEESVKKILKAKYIVGLHTLTPLDPTNVMTDLNSDTNLALSNKIFQEASTLTKNNKSVLPIKDLSSKIAFVPLEEKDYQVFHDYLNKYAKVDIVQIGSPAQLNKLAGYDQIIFGAFMSNETVYKSYKLSNNSKAILQAAPKDKKTSLSLFTSPYGLKDLDLSNVDAVTVHYQNTADAQKAAAQAIFGAIKMDGQLPVEVNQDLKAGSSVVLKDLGRLGFTEPENVQLSKKKLLEIDRIALEAIEKNYTPGMQILVAKEGKIVYEKAFGVQDQRSKKKVETTDLYDVASVTKITSTLPLVMQQVGKGKLRLDMTLGQMDEEAKASNKNSLTLKEILAHQAGLAPWIGFYKETVNVKNARLYLDYYARNADADHGLKVTDNIFAIHSIKDSIYEDIYRSPLGKKKYEYSDLGYYLFQKKLEHDAGESLADLVQEKLYQPMGMFRTTYNPKEKFPLEEIVPTEYDKTFRNQLIHGYVHDQGASMMGGVAGHAGLFSTSYDLAKLMQMYLNKGTYGGVAYIPREVVEEFTKKQFPANHRGAGFDKPSSTNGKGPSMDSFGHTGFTGTMVWADPQQQLVYIFLSNRVNVDPDKNTLSSKKIRESIRQVIYEAILP